MSREHFTGDVRPFSPAEYALLVLNGLKRMTRNTTFWQGYVYPRTAAYENPDPREVREAIDYAITAIRERIAMNMEREREGGMRNG